MMKGDKMIPEDDIIILMNNLTTVQTTILFDSLTGHTEEQIAERLNVSISLVHTNIKRIQHKSEGSAAC